MKKNIKNYDIDGYNFNSKADYDYYLHLKNFKNKKIIENFFIQGMEDNYKSVKNTKYKAKKVQIDGNTFDSKTEADYYIYLLQEKMNGRIIDFSLQPSYELQPKFKKNNKNFRKIEYIADFEVHLWDGKVEVIDVKGFVTSDFSLKLKMFEYKFPDKELKLMKFVQKYGGWITFDEWKKLKKKDKSKNKK